MKKKKQFIDLEDERFGLFFTNNSIELDIMYGRNYLKTDIAHEITLHKINIIETKSHSLYGQAKSYDKKFFPPVKLNAFVVIEENVQDIYGKENGGIIRNDTGNLIANIYLDELKEKQIDIDRGDIIEYNLSGEKSRYYEVQNANNVVDDTKKTLGGYKVYWKKIIAIPVKEDTIPFIKEANE